MKFKTLLLTSAAAFAVVGGAAVAQAADLSVAEPVNYVRVCDAFGAGYWYIPGSDTCLKIGGLVRMDINFHDTGLVMVGDQEHYASWDMAGEYHLNVTAKSMTEYGPLTGWIELRGLSNLASTSNFDYTGASGKREAYIDSAYLQLGMLQAGQLESIYHYFGSYNFGGDLYDAYDDNVNQINLTWAMSGFGFQLAIEDPRSNWGSQLSTTYEMPNIVGDITWSGKNWDAKLSGGFGETSEGSGGGVQLGAQFKLDQIAPGDQFGLVGAWGSSETPDFGAGGGQIDAYAGGNVWSVVAAFRHFWVPTLQSNVTFQYANASDYYVDGDANGYTVAANLVWSPVTNFLAGVEGVYAKTNAPGDDGTWTAKIRLERSW